MPSSPENSMHFYLGLANSHLPIERIPSQGGKPKELSPLYKVCASVELTPQGLSEAAIIVEEMGRFMKNYYEITSVTGALAANQIGFDKSIVVTRRRNENGEFEITPYLNLKITKRSERKNKFPEPCLSIVPDTHIVERAAEIEYEWYDLDGIRHEGSASDDIETIIFQHEEDHLNGITCDITEGKIFGSEHTLESFEEYKSSKIEAA